MQPQGYLQPIIQFVYTPYVYWNMEAYQNLDPEKTIVQMNDNKGRNKGRKQHPTDPKDSIMTQ